MRKGMRMCVVPRLHAAAILSILSLCLASCGGDDAGASARKGPWQERLPLRTAPDSLVVREVESILFAATDSRTPPTTTQSHWNVYCHGDVSWSRQYRITQNVQPAWMDDSWYVEIAFPTGPGLRIHFGNPGIITPVYADWRDSTMWIPDGNVDTAEFNRRKLPCNDPLPRILGT